MDDRNTNNTEKLEDTAARENAAESENSAAEQGGEHKKLLELGEDPAEAANRAKRKKSIGREILEWVVLIAATVAVALLIRTFVFEPIYVDGPSMNDTLQTGDRVFVTKFDCLFGKPARGCVVICHYPDRSENFIKRLVGLPGDKLEIRNGVTYINDQQLNESFITRPKTGENYGPITLGDDEYFVMGDNRANSNDSRRVGPLSGSQIVGYVRYQFFPFNDMHTIEREYTDYVE